MERALKRQSWHNWFNNPVLRIAVPVALQNLLSSLVNLIDNFMLSRLGVISVSATGLANQFFLLILVTIFGITSGVGIFISQYLGQKDFFRIKKCFAIMLATNFTLGSIAGLFAFFQAPLILSFFTNNTQIIDLGSQYLRIVALSYPLMGISVTFYMGLRNVERADVGMYALLISIFFNVVGNYTLIYGNFGFPALGVQGAAIATSIAYFVQFLFTLGVVLFEKNNPAKFGIMHIKAIDRAFIKKIAPVAIPVIFNDMLWVASYVLINKAIAYAAQELYGVYEIVNSIFSTSFVLFLGIGVAASVLIGKTLGAKDYEKSRMLARRFATYPLILGILYSFILYFFAPFFATIFFIELEHQAIFVQFLHILSLFIPFSVFMFIGIIGILRAGGDTKFSLFAEIVSLWLISVPLAFYLAYVTESSFVLIYFCARLSEVIAAILVGYRIFSGKWIKTLI